MNLAAIHIDPSSGASPLNIIGTVTSVTGDATEYLWVWGDGTSDSNTSPASTPHTYSTPGIYQPTLYVSYATGNSPVKATESTVTVTPLPISLATFEVQQAHSYSKQITFVPHLAGGALSVHWDFGNGVTSSGAGAQTQIFEIGAYNVTLTVTYATGAVSASQLVTVVKTPVLTDQRTIWLDLEKLSDEEFSSIRLRGMWNKWPTAIYDNGNYPLRTLFFWPIPQDVNAVELWMWEPLNVFVDPNSELNLPPGYERYLTYQLALELAAEMGKEPALTVVSIATEAEANLKRLNQQLPIAQRSSAAGSLKRRGHAWTYYDIIGMAYVPKTKGY